MKSKSFKAIALFLMIPLLVTAARGQSIYSNSVMSLKPIAYWPLQETTQPPAADIETNYGSLGQIANAYYASEGITSTTTNTAKGFAGAISGSGDSDPAISFPGNNQSLMVVPTTDNRVSLPAGGPLTVEVWAFPLANQQYVSFASQTGPIGSGGNNAGTNTAGWSLNEDWLPYKGTASGNNSLRGFSFHVFNGVGSTGGAEADATYDFNLNTWYHIVGVFDGTNCFVYVNGVNATTYQIAMTGSFVPDHWDPIEFGCNRGLGSNPYHGGLDEVAIYTNALTSTQISNHFNIGTGLAAGTYFTTVQGDNPLMYWRMDAPVYTWPAASTYPTAANYGSLAGAVTNYNTTAHAAVYQPGTLPGVAGPSLPGFGSLTNACAFNGLFGGVDAGYEPALDPTGNTNAFTVVGWFRSNPADNNGRLNTLAGHSDNSWRIKINNGSSVWNYGGASSPQQSIPSTYNVNDGNWHMFAGIYDTTNVTEIIDGYVALSAPAAQNIPGKPTMDAFLGASPDYLVAGNNIYNTVQQYFAGRLAHVAFFTNALTASQIASLYSSATGTALPPPVIAAQPSPYPSIRTVSGGAGTFIQEAVTAVGTPALSYQWYFNTTSNYAGATALVDNVVNYTNSQTSQVTVTNLSAANSGYYFCIVTNNYGATTSAIVAVQVQMSPVITAQSPGGSFSLYPNQSASLSVTVNGAAPLTYLWYTNGVADTTAGTASTYSVTGAQAAMNGFTYQCIVGNGSGSATGALDRLTILALPASIANSPYSTNILALNPTAYWPMHETETQPFLGDIETNYGTLGAPGNGYYQDWKTPVVTHNVPGAIAGNSDTALEFYNVPNDALVVPHSSPKMTIMYPYTLEAWIKPEADNSGGVGSYMVIMGQGGGAGLDNGAGRGGFALQYSGTPDTFSLVIWTNASSGNQPYEQKTTAGYPPGVWYHLAVTYDGTNVTYYVNDQVAGFGTLQTGFPSQMNPDTWSPFTIGAGRWGGSGDSQPFIGAMDEVAVYTNLLTPTQIQNHYLSGTTASSNYFQTVANDSPYLYYHMDAPAYVAPPTNNWPVLTNYGTAGINGVYVPSTVPGSASGPSVAGLAANNAMPGNQVSAYADAGIYPGINPVTPTTPFSCTFWFKGNPADPRWNGLMAGNDADWRCLLNPSGQAQGHGNGDTASPTVNNDGLWHQFLLTFAPSNGIVLGVTPNGQLFGTNNVYVDGILVKSAVGANSNNYASQPGPDVLLGDEYGQQDPVANSGGRSLGGAMCEAAFFYGTVLTPAQARSLYDSAGVKAFIATQPRSLTVNQNSAFTNSAAGDGTDPLAYQWYFNSSSNYSGATKLTDNGRITGTATSALGDSSAALADSGYYYVIVTNNYGAATSSIVTLTVNSSVVFTNSTPVPYTNVFALYAGVSPTFTVGVGGAAPIMFRWYTNGVLVVGATSNGFTWNGVEGTNVTCIASNTFGPATNSWAWNLISTNGLPVYPQNVLALHPSGYWRLNEGPDDNAGDMGAICHDYVGGNDGLFTNAYLAQAGSGYNPTQDPSDTACNFGFFSNPYSLAGNIQNVDFSCPLGSNAEFTVEAWVNPQYTPTVNTPCIAAKGYYYQEQFDLDCGAGAAKAFRFECRPANGAEIDAYASWGLTNFNALNQWYHLVGVCDEAHGATYLYINGALAGSGVIPVGGGLTNALGTPMKIGSRAPDPVTGDNQQFLGLINDVAVFPYAMTASQVANEYQFPPTITQQPPASTNVDSGGTLTVSAAASGTSPLSFKWYDVNASSYIAGQTNATLVINGLTSNDNYYLTVSNPYGSTNSQTVSVTAATGLTVNPLLPASRQLYAGVTATYAVSVMGTLPIYYHWMTNGVAIQGGTNSTVGFIVPLGTSSVSCTVSNSYNGYTAATAGPATLIGLAAPTNPYPRAVLSDHPIAFWRLNEPDNGLNNGNNGVIANDYVGSHDGTYTNTVLGLSGYNPILDPATAAEFGTNGGALTTFSEMTESDNTGSGIANVDFSQPIGGNAEFSVEAWVNGPPSELANSGIVSIGTWGNEQFTLDTGGVPPGNAYRLSLRDAGNNIHNAVSTTVPDGNWHYLVGVCDAASSNVLIYVDGALAGTSGNDITPGLGLRTRLTPLLIGMRPGPSSSEQFLGTIADVALYNYALSASQVAAHYQLGTVGTLINKNPTNIVFSVSGGGTKLLLTWPTDHIGWTLQAQTNSVHVGISNDWFNVANSTSTNQVVVPLNTSNGTVFYRLIYP